MDIKSSVNEQFSKVAANYATSQVHARGIDLPVMLQQADLRGNESVLDVGTGAGHVAFLFAPHVKKVCGVDLSESMLDVCRESANNNGPANVSFQIGDVEDLPFDDQTFDLVISRYSAHHWPNPIVALDQVHRVLKPNGRFLLGDIVSFDDFSLDTFLQSIELVRDKSHVRDHSVSQWTRMFDEAGFLAERCHRWNCEISFESWVARMQTPAENVNVLRQMLLQATPEIREALAIQSDASFALPGALIRGTKK